MRRLGRINMNSLTVSVIAIGYLAFMVYCIKLLVEADEDEKCDTCGREMEHWDDRTVECKYCNITKKLW